MLEDCHVHHFADDNNLFHINKFPTMLNKLKNCDLKNLSNWLNAKRKYVSTDILRSVSYTIFYSHLNYGNLVWGQITIAIKCLTIL